MAWVEVVPEARAEGRLREVYQRIRERRGRVANVIRVSSQLPDVMDTSVEFYVALMFGKHKLPRAQREMVAVEVSRVNGCAYCVQHHGAALARVADPVLAERVMRGEASGLGPRDLAMLAYARRLTLAPAEARREDVEALRAAGFDDEEVVAVNHIAAYFNMMNRIVHGLGVELEDDKGAHAAYKY